MAIVTFISDFGWSDPYVASVKAKLLSLNKNLQIIDISHEITHYNIMHGAYVLKNVFRDFPIGTVHLAAVNVPIKGQERMIAVKLEEHYFVGFDNGFFSLISEKKPSAIIELRKDISFSPLFPERSILANAVVSLASGISIYNLGIERTDIHTLLEVQLKIKENQIWGTIIHVDSYGNAITNITRKVFEEVGQGRLFEILFFREKITRLSENYFDQGEAEYVAVLNSYDYLEIALCNDKASELLGLHLNTNIQVRFL
jgi:S-adenosylmethionine hydrolase